MEWALEIRAAGEIGLAMLLGGLIGAERQSASKPAGFRTHMLVAGAAAMFIVLGRSLVQDFGAGAYPDVVRADPIRTIQAVVVGIGFLGGGTIFTSRDEGSVHGLTTAASILVASGLGIAVAVREYVLAFAVAGLVLLVLRGLGKLERWLQRPSRKPS